MTVGRYSKKTRKGKKARRKRVNPAHKKINPRSKLGRAILGINKINNDFMKATEKKIPVLPHYKFDPNTGEKLQ